MSSAEERDLAGRVDRALTAITPGPAPVDAIIRRGRGIRWRRRAVAAGAVAVVAALAVALPSLYQALHIGRPGPSRQSLTVAKLGPIARDGVVGSGTLDGKPWTVRLAHGPDPVATAAGLPATSRLGTRPASSDPVTIHIAGWPSDQRLLAGPVSPAVTFLTMQLANGTTYRLYPVAWHGHDYVGLVVPWNLPLARITAYSQHGELAYAIPYPASGRFPWVVSWLRPGAAVPPVASATVAHGTSGNGGTTGGIWWVRVQVGPWGACFIDQDNGPGIWCRPIRSYPPNAVTLVMTGPTIGERAGTTGRAVAYIELRLSNGKTTRLHVLHIGGEGFYALSIATHQVASWTAYTTTGQPIAHGTGVPG
jgi:hypothetical protein